MYCFNRFEVKDFFSSRHRNRSDNILTRLINELVRAFNGHSSLPKLIVVILDNDLIRNAKHEGYGISVHFGVLLEDLISEFDRVISEYKSFLPSKAKREYFPHVIWIAMPTHRGFGENSNNKRVKFGESLLTQVISSKYYNKMSVLKMVKFWHSEDPLLFNEKEYRFTSEGLYRYWLSIDAAVKFWDTILFDKFQKKSTMQQQQVDSRRSNGNSSQDKHPTSSTDPERDRFHWRR